MKLRVARSEARSIADAARIAGYSTANLRLLDLQGVVRPERFEFGGKLVRVYLPHHIKALKKHKASTKRGRKAKKPKLKLK